MKRFTVECDECGKKQSFADAKDITYAHWKILAWKVKMGEPLCLCDKCEPKKKKE